MSTVSSGRTRLWKVAAGFLFVTGLVTLAIASVQLPPSATPAFSSSGWLIPSMHVAEAGADIGPGSDEAQLVSSPAAP